MRCAALSAPTRPSSSSGSSTLKERSLVTLRGLSDLGSLALVHELALRLTVTSSPAVALISDAELLLGSLIGLWTAAAWADRIRGVSSRLTREATALPERWDANLIYNPSFDDDEIIPAFAWLSAFDELDGIAAAELLRTLLIAPSPTSRARVAAALAAYPVRSNITLAALAVLARDNDARVRGAAALCATAYADAGILKLTEGEGGYEHVMKMASTFEQEEQVDGEESNLMMMMRMMNEDASGTSRQEEDENTALRLILQRILDDPQPVDFPLVPASGVSRAAWLADAVDAHVDAMREAALTRPDLGGITASLSRRICPAMTEEDEEVRMTRQEKDMVIDVRSRNPPAMMDSLNWSELHGVCALALVPALYELVAVADGADLPLRFVGLGWLLAVGGLAAYPQSARLWMKFGETMDGSWKR